MAAAELVGRAALHFAHAADAASDGSGNAEPRFSLAALARTLGTTHAVLRRSFRQVTGLAPRDFASALRIQRFKSLLRAGKSITDALYESGYGSTSRIYEKSDVQLGMTPSSYRKGGKGMRIGYTIAKSLLGKVLVGATDRGISAVYLGGTESSLLAELRAEYPRAQITRAPQTYRKWVAEILQRIAGGPPQMDLPLDVLATAFQRRVWQELQRIPPGSTRTYSQVAAAIGRESAVRAVARACATNPVSIAIPCHRVIRRDGNLAGYRWGISKKEALLAQERATNK
ncbi:MAG: hypothetical protein NVS9B4_10800 [Candidatus Acidiferrum sp.]